MKAVEQIRAGDESLLMRSEALASSPLRVDRWSWALLQRDVEGLRSALEGLAARTAAAEARLGAADVRNVEVASDFEARLVAVEARSAESANSVEALRMNLRGVEALAREPKLPPLASPSATAGDPSAEVAAAAAAAAAASADAVEENRRLGLRLAGCEARMTEFAAQLDKVSVEPSAGDERRPREFSEARALDVVAPADALESGLAASMPPAAEAPATRPELQELYEEVRRVEEDASKADKELETKIMRWAARMSDGLELARSHSDTLQEQHKRNVHEAAEVFRDSLKEARDAMDRESEALLNKIVKAESRVTQAVVEAEHNMLSAARHRADVTVSALQQDVLCQVSQLGCRLEDLERALQEESRLATQRTEKGDASVVAECRVFCDTAVAQGSAALRAEFEQALRGLGGRLEGSLAATQERLLRATATRTSDAAIASDATVGAAGGVAGAFAPRAVAGDASASAAAVAATPSHSALRTEMERLKQGVGGAREEVWAHCHQAEVRAGELRVRTQQEIQTLGQELSQLRAASTSLASGVLRALEVLGLLEPEARPGGANGAAQATPRSPKTPVWHGRRIEDLLNWERSGASLALRISERWLAQDLRGSPTLLALLARKVDEEDFAKLRQLVFAVSKKGTASN